MSTVVTPLITADEFERMSLERPTELVRGELVEQAMPNVEHGSVCAQITIALGVWAKSGKHGPVFSNDSFVLTESDPDTVRGPDCGYIRRDRLVNGKLPKGTLRIPADLAVEVLSPSDRLPRVLDKVLEYLESGVGEVWVVDPDDRSVEVYRGDRRKPRRFNEDDELTSPDVLPGFACRVGEFFADL